MSAVIYHRPPNRLKKLISRPGGVRLRDAIANAESNLASISDALAHEVDAAIARLQALSPTAAADETARTAMYVDATSIAGLGGLCGMESVGRVAYMLCELIDAYLEINTWNAGAVTAHIDSMALLRRSGMDEPQARDLIMTGLQALVERVTSSSTASEPSQPT